MEMTLKEINVYLKNQPAVPVLKSLYVCNLEWKTTIDDLKNFFSPYGLVTAVDIKRNRDTGLPMGYGFITMENADQAMTELNGKELRGRTIKIKDARERDQTPVNVTPVMPIQKIKRRNYNVVSIKRRTYQEESI
jgi:RNA recognition motif-containing protein